MPAVWAFAADAPRGGPSTKSFGEGGGYHHPDGAVGQYLEDAPRQDRPLPDPLPDNPRLAAPAAPVSLWSDLVQPLDMSAEDAGAADTDSASDLGRRDYESHLLGLKDTSARPRTQDPERVAKTDAGESMLFVSLELDPRESGSLRDCVAGLGAVAGFSADARFEPLAGPAGAVIISGWMPAAGLASALSRPGVKRLRVETRPRPSAPRDDGRVPHRTAPGGPCARPRGRRCGRRRACFRGGLSSDPRRGDGDGSRWADDCPRCRETASLPSGQGHGPSRCSQNFAFGVGLGGFQRDPLADAPLGRARFRPFRLGGGNVGGSAHSRYGAAGPAPCRRARALRFRPLPLKGRIS